MSHVCTDLNRFHCWHLVCTKVQTHEVTCDGERDRERQNPENNDRESGAVRLQFLFLFLFFTKMKQLNVVSGVWSANRIV